MLHFNEDNTFTICNSAGWALHETDLMLSVSVYLSVLSRVAQIVTAPHRDL